jgi:3D (Asp-Asp-Asp) domain-containing protein
MKLNDKRTLTHRDVKMLALCTLCFLMGGIVVRVGDHIEAKANEPTWAEQQLQLSLISAKGSCQGENCKIDKDDIDGIKTPPEATRANVTKEKKVAKLTAYSCGGITTEAEKAMNCPNGITSSGTIPRVGTMACDRANLGRRFRIEGLGDFTCEDTGGAIKGAGRFDIYLDTIAEAYQFGVKYLEYELID